MFLNLKEMRKLFKSSVLLIIAECVITVILLAVAFNFFKIIQHSVKRGFFCDDESLKYPYHSDTIDGTWLLVLSFYVPIAIILIGETMLFLLVKRQSKIADNQGLAAALLQLHHNLIPFLCGFALHLCLVHATKIIAGRLRPHFFDVCRPYRRLDGSTCDNPKNHGIYIQDYECNVSTRPYISQHMINSLHQSFPSGHASYIFYGIIFIILYLQRFSKTLRQHRINVGLFMIIVQIFCALLAWLVAVSRVMDYKHHWSDVLVGIVLGTSFAIAVTLYVCQQLKSVESWLEGVKSSNPDTTSTTTFATTMPNTILVP